MKIIIGGAGDVGSHLAKLLSNEEQDITIIDADQSKLSVLDANYNLMTVLGSPTAFNTLREARVGKADLFIAVTPYETDNVVACAFAKKLGAKRTVARIDNFGYMATENRQYLQSLGVDHTIYPEYLAALEIITALNRSWVRHWFELLDGELIVVGIKINANSKIAGMQLRDFSMSLHQFHVSAINRDHETIIPGGSDHILDGDILYITTTRNHVDDLLELTGKTEIKVKRVMIMGGGKIAIRLVNLAEGRFKFKIIDNNLEVCNKLPEKCPDCDIIYGDARDVELLDEAGIDDIDAFVALSKSSEANILACLTAKELGVSKTIAEVENIQFISQAEGLNIGTIVNKKLLASSSIFQLLLDNDPSTSKCLALADAEVAELEVKPGSKITKAAVKDLHLPHEMTLGGLIRDGKGMLVTGGTVIQPGDRVVIFCLHGAIHKVEKLFN